MCLTGKRAWHAPGARLVFLALIATTLVLPAAPAGAVTITGPAAFAQLVPADGGIVTVLRPLVSTEVFDAAEIRSSGYTLTIDGVNQKPSFSYRILGWNGTTPILDKRYATIKVTARTNLAPGVHTVRVGIVNNAGVSSSCTWTFSVSQAPVLVDPLPAPGSVETSRVPPISVRVSANASGLTARMWVDGTEVPALYDPVSTRVTGFPAGRLAYETSHDVTVTATNLSGASTTSSWSFFVYARAPMALVTTCQSCHTDQPAQHPMTDCDTCHGPDGPLGEDGISGPPHSPFWLSPPEWSCTTCHSPGYATVPPLHQFTPDAYHASDEACISCHARNLPMEHNRNGMTCLTCHTSATPTVRAAIAAGDTRCSACHAGAGDHLPVHDVAVTPACAGCHAEANLVSIHEEAGCEACHESTDDRVLGAIEAGNKDCSACHDYTLSTGLDHEGFAALHAPPASPQCWPCHPHGERTVVETVEGFHPACSTCHNDTVTTDGITVDCLNCHGTEPGKYPYHAAFETAHTAVTAASLECAACHESANIAVIHTADVGACQLCHLPGQGDCNYCHTVHGMVQYPAECGNALCHGGLTLDLHYDESSHEATFAPEADCLICHDVDLATEHSKPSSGAITCVQCHEIAVDNLANPWDGTCEACHPVRHDYQTQKHTSPTTSACFGVGCHDPSKDISSVHVLYGGPGTEYPQFASSCALCHANPAVDVFTSGAACTGVCHTLAPHMQYATKHTPTSASDGCTQGYCHGSDLSAIHGAGPEDWSKCAVCHADPGNWAKTADCASCHAAQPHPDFEAKHLGTATSGRVPVFQNHQGTSWIAPCAMCHATTQLLSIHANDCELCHGGTVPVSSFESWNGSCQQGACHPTIDHTRAYAAHDALANADECFACHADDWTVSTSACDACHDPSAATPVTTSDAAASYVGYARITLSAPGVAWTFFRVDGGPRQSGSLVQVAGPTSGVANHTLEFWSVDDAGREELPHTTVTFDILADTSPPTTTSDALANYIGPATVRLTATDDGSLPVTVTYWRIDGGEQTAGTTVTVPQPISGTVSSTLEFWSVDAAGNEEIPHKTVVLSITADTVAPVTTSNAPLYDKTTAGLRVTFTATDADPSSGIAATYRSLNGGTPAVGTSIFVYGQGAHTLRYWSVDRAGNVEAATTTTIIKDWTAPVTVANVQPAYVGPAIIHLTGTDALAGVAATYYRLDGGPTVAGTDLVVTTDGTHSLTYWSSDRAGNNEVQRTATFTVTGGGLDVFPPVTTSNAVSAYEGDATILLSATDIGSGVASTHYRLDGGADTVGTVVSVPAPPSSTESHTLEFWSVDRDGNSETPTTVTFTCTHVETGTIAFRWDSPPAGAWAYLYVDGLEVAYGEMPGWDGWLFATVPISAIPYDVGAYTFDPASSPEPVWSSGSVVVDEPGETVIWSP